MKMTNMKKQQLRCLSRVNLCMFYAISGPATYTYQYSNPCDVSHIKSTKCFNYTYYYFPNFRLIFILSLLTSQTCSIFLHLTFQSINHLLINQCVPLTRTNQHTTTLPFSYQIFNALFQIILFSLNSTHNTVSRHQFSIQK